VTESTVVGVPADAARFEVSTQVDATFHSPITGPSPRQLCRCHSCDSMGCASRSIPTSTARSVRSSSQSMRSWANVRVLGFPRTRRSGGLARGRGVSGRGGARRGEPSRGRRRSGCPEGVAVGEAMVWVAGSEGVARVDSASLHEFVTWPLRFPAGRSPAARCDKIAELAQDLAALLGQVRCASADD
jgi:hypothetical protein